MPKLKGKQQPSTCSFCGKQRDQIRHLIAGPGQVSICNECVALCDSIINSEAAQHPNVPAAAPRPHRPRSDLPTYRCSFCGKTQDQVQRLIAGPHQVYICDECVVLSQEIISNIQEPLHPTLEGNQ